jgi:hypothetical protein
MGTAQISKTLVFNSTLTWLVTQEDFSALTQQESIKSYMILNTFALSSPNISFSNFLLRIHLSDAVHDILSREGMSQPAIPPSKYSPDLNQTGWLIRSLPGWQLNFN